MRPRTRRLPIAAAGAGRPVPRSLLRRPTRGIWQPVATPTTPDDHRDRVPGRRPPLVRDVERDLQAQRKRLDQQLDQPGSNFNSIAFNPSGTLGIAVGDAGVVWRYSGGSWTKLPALLTYNFPSDSCPGSGGPYALNSPITADFSHVRWMSDSTVFVFSERGGSLMRSANGGASFTEISRQSDGSCRINYYGDWIEDAFVLPSNPNHMLFLTGYYGRVYLSTNGLSSQAAHRGYACGDRLVVDPGNPAVMYSGGDGCSLFSVSEDGGQNWAGPQMKKGRTASSRAFDAFGTTALGAGDAGYIFNSIDRREAYAQPADGAMATNDWRAVDVASASVGAVGGLNGGLVVTNQLDTIPDIVKPTGSVAGPASGVAGSTLTFTANVERQRRRLGHRSRRLLVDERFGRRRLGTDGRDRVPGLGLLHGPRELPRSRRERGDRRTRTSTSARRRATTRTRRGRSPAPPSPSPASPRRSRSTRPTPARASTPARSAGRATSVGAGVSGSTRVADVPEGGHRHGLGPLRRPCGQRELGERRRARWRPSPRIGRSRSRWTRPSRRSRRPRAAST